MIIDAIFSVILAIPNALLDSIPNVSLSFASDSMSYLNSVLAYIGYFLPITQLIPLMVIELAVMVLKIVWAIVLMVKSFIPTMGA